MPISATNSPDRNYTDLIGSGSNKTEKGRYLQRSI